MTSLAHRLYIRMTLCPCQFNSSCSHCQLDLRAIKTFPEAYANLVEVERNFRADAGKIESHS